LLHFNNFVANLKSMKKKLAYAAGLLVIVCSFTACDMIGGNCQVCQLNSYEDNILIATVREAEYCDDELLAIKAIPPETSGGVTTKWECR